MSKNRVVDNRTRHHTDDSSLGSFKYEDQESTEHDGDVEDISDGERTSSSESRNRPTYYPGNNDDDTPSEFMVNAMDAEELRQSVRRRSKKWSREDAPRLEVPGATTSLSGSPHDSEDDEVSTPSGDNMDRNPLSDSLEGGRREQYIKSAFDSLTSTLPASHRTPTTYSSQAATSSLSSQHLSRTPPDPEATARRDLLQRRIIETRRQLENVAYRSNLKSSQSTTDLSYIPEKDSPRRNRPVSVVIPTNSRPYANRAQLSPYDNEEGGMRRAISLSDLASKPSPAPRTTQAAPTKPTQQAPTTKATTGFVRPAPRYSVKPNMTRSSSVGVLNQSDSESDPQPARGSTARTGGLMRPTISSLNKAAASTARRRGLTNAYSSVNLHNQEDSSSEAEDRNGEKPAVAPRNGDQRRMGRSGSERDLSAKAREVTARLTGANPRPARHKQESTSSNDAAVSSSQLCSSLTDQLTKTASKVVQLYRSLQKEPNSAAEISGLEAAILETQKLLQGAVLRQNGDGHTSLSSEGERGGGTRLQPGKDATNPAMTLIEQYSDILLNIVQNKMVNQYSQPQSLPPSATEPGGDS